MDHHPASEAALCERDVEREAAEAKAVTLGAKASDVKRLSDHDLRLKLLQLRQAEQTPLPSKAQMKHTALIAGRLGWGKVTAASLADVLSDLESEFRISVAKDGLVEVEEMLSVTRSLVSGLPLALYHHTATALLPKIAKHGLVVGRQTNFFNSQAGVYLSLIPSGEPVEIYSKRAAYLHGGDPVTLRVRRTLDQIEPDPDDADLP
ncbi:MAG: hypothetical protein O9327_10495, partial [Polaromonas sp.]|nr:hypothetical protein [Polaromonas sp.]